jgi:hypothetical protein
MVKLQFLVATLALSSAPLALSQPDGSFVQIVTEGDTLPGGAGTVLQVFDGILNNSGDVAFAFRSMNGSTAYQGLALWSDGTIEIRELSGTSVGPSGESWQSFSRRPLNLTDDGAILFTGSLDTGPLNQGVVTGIGLSTPGNGPATICYENQPLPDGNGIFDGAGLQIARMNQAREIGVLFVIDDATLPRTDTPGLFLWSDGALSFAHEPRSESNGDEQRSVIDFVINDQGVLAFAFPRRVGSVFESPFVIRDNGANTVLITAFDPAPGITGATFGGLTNAYGKFRINNARETAFHTTISGSGIDSFINSALWLAPPPTSPIALVAQEGDAVSGGTATIGDLQVISGNFALNDNGVTAFGVSVNGVYYSHDSSTQLVAEAGDSPPRGDGILGLQGSPTGGTPIPGNAGPGWLALNNSNQVAFLTNIAGSTSGDDAICLYHPDNGLTIPVRTGDTLFGSAVGNLWFQVDSITGEEGTGFNDSGEIAFRYSLLGGTTGLALWQPDPAPCTADVNGDGALTPTDFTAWINAFNNSLPECDQNGDGSCTPTDFTAWIANFNAGC